MEFKDLCKDPQFILKILALILVLANTVLLEEKAPVFPHYTHEVLTLSILFAILVLPVMIYDYAIQSGQWDTMYMFMAMLTALNLVGSVLTLVSYFERPYPPTYELEMTLLSCVTFCLLVADCGVYIGKNKGLLGVVSFNE